MEPDARYMRRALAHAARPPRRTSPNPAVGCVIVRNGVVVGEGVTQPPGEAHAEVMALRAAGEQARGADVYVTLEPCCHWGRTAPCTEALINAGVRRVFAGTIDPNPLVAGRGLAELRAAGIEVVPGPLEAACEAAIAPFRRSIEEGRPWVVLKAASSLDGRLATASGDARWITGEGARRDAHRLRAASDAVLVGIETALLDDPLLNVRGVPGEDPLRVVLDTRLRLPPTARLLGPRAIVFHGPGVDTARVEALAARGARVLEVPVNGAHLDLAAALRALQGLGCVRVMVEGGGRVHGALLSARLADEVQLYLSSVLIGQGRTWLDAISATTIADAWRLDAPRVRRFGDDLRIRGRIRYPAAPCSPA
jgi:diaminohydroxyphosphoribosylaminopyrimidine deaminase/5-amino-6-(5-phosphoribosylamino)uracil reductase